MHQRLLISYFILSNNEIDRLCIQWATSERVQEQHNFTVYLYQKLDPSIDFNSVTQTLSRVLPACCVSVLL
jgi:hypothetical protein